MVSPNGEPVNTYRCPAGHKREMDAPSGAFSDKWIVQKRCPECDKKVDWSKVAPDAPQPIQKPVTSAKDPALGSRQKAVLRALGDLQWHEGHILTHPSTGGSEGLRRVRELREMGAPIEMRKRPKVATRDYRLTRRWP